MFHFLLLVSRQGKVRLCRWFGDCEAEKEPKSFLHAAARSCKERNLLIKDAASRVLQRNARQCNVVEWKDDTKLVYKRYASLFFIACVEANENALLVLELIHHYVEVLDKYFGNVCELDLIFNFHKAYYLLDEVICGGEVQETSKKTILRIVSAEDALTEDSSGKPSKLS
ncbi:clathrin-associated adaptor complex small chan, putative [Eimeria acervulina]|uniref:AP complex subunit sigma n=1 Tax=Eimeria acervulina TaxID=5801 RepID=U6GA39_EIMAC|nr:clathrin-associated adaptor complex small chan, putative [Eimeria acervulina]CDI77111.1 clathrin-associated adaptor complex small chan, putative [Eimeria acervulina]